MLFFDCKSYSTASNHKIKWTFYGILQNTVAAAVSFEMAHNLTLEWARGKKGSVYSYCLGVAAGLIEMAKEEKKTEKRLASQRERDAMNAKLETETTFLAAKVEEETLASPLQDYVDAVTDDDSSDDSESAFSAGGLDADETDETETKPTFKLENEVPLDLFADFEEELQKIIKQERSPTPLWLKSNPDTEDAIVKLENEPTDDQDIQELSHWKSSQQIVLFRKSAMNVAEEYLKARETKLRKGKKRKYSVRDSGAFEAGKLDGRNIDVRHRRVEYTR